MKKNPMGGKGRMKSDNWKRHFRSIRRRNKRDRQKKMSELAKLHLYGSKRYERIPNVTPMNSDI